MTRTTTPPQVFRPARRDVVRGSVSCLGTGIIAGTALAIGLFSLVGLCAWLAGV